jgi:pilus assembly protein CpaE
MRKVNILVAGRYRDGVQAAMDLLADNSQCKTEARLLVNGHSGPLHGLSDLPDLLLLCDIQCQEELKLLAESPAEERPAMIVFGSGNDANSIRQAMRAGARDYLTLPLDEKEVNDAIGKVVEEIASNRPNKTGSLHVFINGKGGSGATFLATNVAHGLASDDQAVTLVDLDLQFAGLCRYLDLKPTRDLLEALQTADDMDATSAEAFTTRHDSGLHLLSAMTEKLHMNNDIPPERLISMLKTYQSCNDFVIVDLPRHIDLLSASVLEHADRISIVMQQSFPHLHDTARLLQIMRDELGIANSQLNIVVNRYAKDSPIQLKDIENAMNLKDLVKIPNHYRLTAESVNNGMPLADITRKRAVMKDLKAFYKSLGVPKVNESGTAGLSLHSLFRR